MAITKENEKPHIAFLPSPGMGHITPLFELAQRLVINHGFHVSFFVITTDASAAQNELFRPENLPADFDAVEIPPVKNISSFFTDDMRVITRLAIIVRESLNQYLKSLLIKLRPKALVIDLFCTDAFEICKAIDFEIPVYSFFTASTILMAFSLYLPELDRKVDGEFVDLPEPIRTPGCNPIAPHDLLDQVRDRKNDEYKWYLLHVSRLPLAAGIFVNSWDDLEPLSLKALEDNLFFKNIPLPPVHPIGPLIKKQDYNNNEVVTEKDAEILTWLDNQPSDSVLFVVFGSGGTLTGEQLVELAWGLEMSQQRFILVARKPSDASACAAFFNAGSGEDDPLLYLPEGFVERTKGRGIVVPYWAPQIAILGHQSTGGFLSHCGWNSTLESLVNGVPIIAWPLYAEQRMNATFLMEEVGVAMKFSVYPGEELISRKEIEKVVRIVMEEEKGMDMRRKAKELKESAKKTLSSDGSSSESLCRVVQFWKSHN